MYSERHRPDLQITIEAIAFRRCVVAYAPEVRWVVFVGGDLQHETLGVALCRKDCGDAVVEVRGQLGER